MKTDVAVYTFVFVAAVVGKDRRVTREIAENGITRHTSLILLSFLLPNGVKYFAVNIFVHFFFW